MEILILILVLASPVVGAIVAHKIEKSPIVGFGFGLFFPVVAPIVYLFLLAEYKKKGKVDLTIK